MSKKEQDELTGVETTGHEWDGIKELNRPLPRWWLWTTYATIVWGIAYFYFMPSIPYFSDGEMTFYKGSLEYTERSSVKAEIKAATDEKQIYVQKVSETSIVDIQKDEELLNFALRGGEAAFGDNCAPCHGSGAQGFTGFPNLNDDDWLWGGTMEDIYTTLAYGIRWEGEENTRFSEMPRFLDDQLLEREQIQDVVQFVLSLSGQSEDKNSIERGKSVYAENCESCHGVNGKGDRSQGAPDLTDAIWLFGDSPSDIYETVAHSRRGVMPAWKDRLDEATLKQLSIYVHSLGGGEISKVPSQSENEEQGE